MPHVLLKAWYFDTVLSETRHNEEVEAKYEAI